MTGLAFDPDGFCYDCQCQPADCTCPRRSPMMVINTSSSNSSEPLSSGMLVTLADVAPERVSWLWPGRLPAGKLVTLDGDPALGKSTLALTLAAHVSTGRPWPDGAGCPLGDVVILSAEDGMADTIRPRLDAAGGDPARVHCLTAIRTVTEGGDPTTRPPTLADVTQIREVIEVTRARLLVVDVLMAYLPGRVDSHRDQDVRAVLHRVAEVAEITGCTVLLLRHLNKSGATTPMYRGGGSIGIVGAARAAYVVAPDPDDDTGRTRVLACIKSNLAEQPPSLTYRLESIPGSHVARVVWGPVSQHSAADLLRSTDPAEDRSERDDAGAFILDHLTDHGGIAPAREVMAAARKAGFSRSTVYRAADRIKVHKEKSGMTGPWYWRHPDDRPEDPTEDTEGPHPQNTGSSVSSWDLRNPVRPPSSHLVHSDQPSDPRPNGDGHPDDRPEDPTEDTEGPSSQNVEPSGPSRDLRRPDDSTDGIPAELLTVMIAPAAPWASRWVRQQRAAGENHNNTTEESERGK